MVGEAQKSLKSVRYGMVEYLEGAGCRSDLQVVTVTEQYQFSDILYKTVHCTAL